MRTEHQEKVFASLHQEQNRRLKERLEHIATRPPAGQEPSSAWSEKLTSLDAAIDKNKFQIIELQDL
jgi:hypothetical protein